MRAAAPPPPAARSQQPVPAGRWARVRGWLLALVLLAALAVIGGYAAWLQGTQQADVPVLSYDSNRTDGARALALWLEALGYNVAPLEYQDFAVPPGTDILLVLVPYNAFDAGEVKTLDAWVRRGGTAIIAVDAYSASRDDPLLQYFDAQLVPLPVGSALLTNTLTLDEPLLVHPPVGEIAARPRWGLVVRREGAVIHAWQADRAVLVSFAVGPGRVWLTTLGDAFSNLQLRNSGNARLVLNLLGRAPGARRIVFDEVHHGRLPAAMTLEGWLTGTPAGWAILFGAGALLLYVILTGRRFGRPMPAPHVAVRRAPEEYITAMANLFRRGGLRDATARHYYDRLKRVLARRYRMNPTQGDAEFVAELARYRDGLDGAELLKLLRALGQGGVGEAELVRLAGEADRWEREA